MSTHDNPAERLHGLLAAYVAYPKAANALDVWRDVLGFDDAAPAPRLLRYLSAIAELPAEIRAGVVSLPERRRERLTRHLGRVESSMDLLPQVGAVPAQQFQQYYRPEVLIALEEASDVLHEVKPRHLVKRDSLATIRDEVMALIELLGDDAELEPRFRDALREKLISAVRLLDEEEVRGGAAVEDAFDVIVGTVHRHRADVAKHRGTTPMQHLGLICNGLLVVLNVAAAGLQLPVAVREALGPADPTVVNVTVNNVEAPETIESTIVLPKAAG